MIRAVEPTGTLVTMGPIAVARVESPMGVCQERDLTM
jgi:hypothetical protein